MKPVGKIILPIAVLGAGALIAFVMIQARRPVEPEPHEPAVPIVRTLPLKPQEHRFVVRAQGTVMPRTDVQLISEVSGRVVAVSPSFAAGGFFEMDDALVRIDSRDYELAVVRAKATLAEAQVRLQREEAEGEVARNEWKSLGRGEASPLLLREPQLAEARAAVASAEANLKIAELDLERCQIKAPFAGRVWSKGVDVGQFLSKGAAVARIYAVDYAEVRLPLPLDELAYLDLPLEFRGESRGEGPAVVLRAQFGGRREEWAGRIVRTEGEIDSRTRMMTAVARVDNPYGRRSDDRPPLAVGLFVDAEIEGQWAGEVFIAPRAALRGRDQLMVMDRESRLRFRPIEALRLERDRVIFKSGLQDGDLVCVSPLEAPVDGMKVRSAQDESARATSRL